MKSEVKLLDYWNSDREIAESAWSSTQRENRTDEDVYRVITQSIVPRHHDTPKEAVWFRFWVRCPIFVERQLDKYRMTIQKQDFRVEYEEGSLGRFGITQNELSLRYRTMPNGYIEPPADVEEILGRTRDREGLKAHYSVGLYYEVMEFAASTYEAITRNLELAVARKEITRKELRRVREFYRGVLGTGFYTDMQIICNLNALEHILNQRLAPEAQPETREVAGMMLQQVQEACPVTIATMIKINQWKENE